MLEMLRTILLLLLLLLLIMCVIVYVCVCVILCVTVVDYFKMISEKWGGGYSPSVPPPL